MTDDIIRGSDRREFLTRAGLAGLGATAAGGLLTERALAQGKGKPAYDLPGEASLGGNISKSVWYWINVSDLDRAIEFYEKTWPVKRAEEMNGPAQAFPSLGISKGQFKARLMRDSQPFQGAGILLVQWLDPTPVGIALQGGQPHRLVPPARQRLADRADGPLRGGPGGRRPPVRPAERDPDPRRPDHLLVRVPRPRRHHAGVHRPARPDAGRPARHQHRPERQLPRHPAVVQVLLAA